MYFIMIINSPKIVHQNIMVFNLKKLFLSSNIVIVNKSVMISPKIRLFL